MSKTWYPVVDYKYCIQCGFCVAKCENGVYDKEKHPIPVVVNPDACKDRCNGCGVYCVARAITYAGDETGLNPAEKNTDSCLECDNKLTLTMIGRGVKHYTCRNCDKTFITCSSCGTMVNAGWLCAACKQRKG